MQKQFSPQLQSLVNNSAEKAKFDEMVTAGFSDRIPDSDLPFSTWEYRCAFEIVADKSDWKQPISATIHEADRAIVERAIVNATASRASFADAGNGMLHVAADGYYIGTGEVASYEEFTL